MMSLGAGALEVSGGSNAISREEVSMETKAGTTARAAYRVFSHDVTAAILVSQNNETAAMLVSQTRPLGVELFSYSNAIFCSNTFA